MGRTRLSLNDWGICEEIISLYMLIILCLKFVGKFLIMQLDMRS